MNVHDFDLAYVKADGVPMHSPGIPAAHASVTKARGAVCIMSEEGSNIITASTVTVDTLHKRFIWVPNKRLDHTNLRAYRSNAPVDFEKTTGLGDMDRRLQLDRVVSFPKSSSFWRDGGCEIRLVKKDCVQESRESLASVIESGYMV